MDHSYDISGVLPPPDMSNEAKGVASRLGLGLLAYAGCAVAVVFLTQMIISLAFGIDVYAGLSENIYFVWGVQVLSMYVIALPIFFLITRSLPKQKCEAKGISLGEFTATFLVSEAVMTVGSMISTYIVAIISSLVGHEVADKTSEVIMQTPLWLIILVAVVIGPLVEELIFRHGLIPALRVYGDRFAIVVSAIAFGIFHGNFSQIVYATGIGLVLGYVYTKTGSVKYSFLLHMLMNFFGTVPTIMLGDSVDNIAGITEDMLLPEGEELGAFMLDFIKVMDVALLQYGLMLGGVFMLFYAIKHRLIRIPSDTSVYVSREGLTRATLLNVGTILFVIYCLAQMAISVFVQ